MSEGIMGVIATLLAVLVIVVAFFAGRESVVSDCQNYQQFRADSHSFICQAKP